MAAGLFELRKDPITGWWVATVVDRAFHRDRFARAAEPVDDHLFGCANCTTPEGDGIRVRMLKDFAFHVVGTGEDARELDRGLGQVALAQARATGSWRTIVAPPGEHRPLHAVGNEMIEALVGGARDALAEARATRPDRLPPGRPELGGPGGRPDQPPVPRPVRPAPDPAPDRRGDGRRRPVRHPGGGVPVLPARPGRVAPPGPARLGGSRPAWPSPRSPRAPRSRSWIVPRRHEADFGRGHGPTSRPPRRRSARSWPGSPRASMARPTTSSSTPRRCASRSTPPTTGTGRSTRACARSPASSWDRPAGQSRLARGCGRGAPRTGGAERGRHRLTRGRPGIGTGVTPGGGPPSLGRRARAAH